MRLSAGLFWHLWLVCAVALGQPAPDGVRRAVAEQRQAVTDAAVKYVGTREVGQNRGPVYELFIRPYGYGPGTMYCGLFCHHVFEVAAVKHGVKGAALAANWAKPSTVIVWKKQPIGGGAGAITR